MTSRLSFSGIALISCASVLAGCSGSDSNKTPVVPITGALNDTGITSCSGMEEPEQTCPQPELGNQDAEFGRDHLAANGELTKTGGGVAGFDWSKIDGSGNLLALQDVAWDDSGSEHDGSRWSCVLDNVTELMWEVKESDPAHPRYSEHSYTWYNEMATENGGVAGTEDGGTCATAPCDTRGYVEWVNDNGLCGHQDWRMPTPQELASLAVLSKVIPAMDTEFFPNTSKPRFFTALPNAKDPYQAWYVYFSDGSVSSTGKADASHLRLVRGARK